MESHHSVRKGLRAAQRAIATYSSQLNLPEFDTSEFEGCDEQVAVVDKVIRGILTKIAEICDDIFGKKIEEVFLAAMSDCSLSPANHGTRKKFLKERSPEDTISKTIEESGPSQRLFTSFIQDSARKLRKNPENYLVSVKGLDIALQANINDPNTLPVLELILTVRFEIQNRGTGYTIQIDTPFTSSIKLRAMIRETRLILEAGFKKEDMQLPKAAPPPPLPLPEPIEPEPGNRVRRLATWEEIVEASCYHRTDLAEHTLPPDIANLVKSQPSRYRGLRPEERGLKELLENWLEQA